MRCGTAEKWISRDLDGELPARKKARLDAHVRDCPHCSAVRAQWMSYGELARQRAVAPGPTPEAAWSDVRRALRQQADVSTREREPVRGALPMLRWSVAACAVLLIGTTWLYVGHSGLRAAPGAAAAKVERVETDLPGATLMVYKDTGTGWVIIWVAGDNGEAGAPIDTHQSI